MRPRKLRQRDETTGELSERVLARLRREYSLVASEVWVDDEHRVDFVGFRPERLSPFPSSIERGEFVFVEVKSGMADFKSGHGLTFQGDANWLAALQISRSRSMRPANYRKARRYFARTAGDGFRKNMTSGSVREASARYRLPSCCFGWSAIAPAPGARRVRSFPMVIAHGVPRTTQNSSTISTPSAAIWP